ncbi:MAG: TldD/PmbA family protein [Gemmatimonas sp.]
MAAFDDPLQDPLGFLGDLLTRVRKAGADAADVMLGESQSLSIERRLGKPEGLERSESRDVTLRALVGRRQAVVSATEFSERSISSLVERAVAMARIAPEDPHCGLADPAQLDRVIADLETADDDEPSAEALDERAAAAEDAARSVAGVTNSEGAQASWGRSRTYLVASNGFSGSVAHSRHSVSVSVLAGEGTAMERDDDYAIAIRAADLRDPTDIGRTAGQRAVRRLNPRKIATTRVPVVFEPRTAVSLLGHLASAINGAAVARGTSFLKDKRGEAIFAPTVTVIDDPLRKRGLRSRSFDGEGLPTRMRSLIDGGVLTGFLLDLASARQLKMEPTGSATRGGSGLPSPSTSNLYLVAGTKTPEALMREVGTGLYVTDLIGMGVNIVTGDYSRGAAGFWIENGELAYPVSEITIAGTLLEMFAGLEAANDLTFRWGTDSPTVRLPAMTVAGR